MNLIKEIKKLNVTKMEFKLMNLAKTTGLLLVCLTLGIIDSNIAHSQAGATSVPFLLISPDARASGRGEVGVAIADDLNAVYWNPAGLGFLTHFDGFDEYGDPIETNYRQVALSFSPWLPQFNADLYYSYGTIGQYMEELDGTVALNFTFMNLGEFTRTNEQGQVLGRFISNEFALGLSYGTIIAPDLSMGFQLRYIHSNLTPNDAQSRTSGTGISAAFDLGLLYKPSEMLGYASPVSFGLNLQNIGPKITYRQESDPLPTFLRIGTAFNIVGDNVKGGFIQDEFSELIVAVDFGKLLVKREGSNSDPLPKSLVTGWENPGAQWSFGLEYMYAKAIALRAGFFTEPVALGNRQFYNFGAGVVYDMFRLDFSFINTIEQNHPLANTMRFSMLIDWK